MSTIAPFKAEVVSLIAAGVPGVQVIYGPATGAALTGPDVLVVGGAAGTTTPGALAFGGAAQRESYDLDVTVSCSRPGPDAQVDATNAAFGFRDAVDVLFRTAVPTTTGVLSALVTGEFELIEDDSAQAATQRNAAVVFRIHVEASI